MTAHYFKNTLNITPAQLANLPLAKNRILLFDATVLDVSKFNLADHLSSFELGVINRRKSPQAKQEYLASRILQKQLVKIAKPQYANIPLNAMSTQFDEASAKLQLYVSGEVINTCISHSHGMVGVALNLANTEFGFDIEKISLKRPFEKLAKHFYHADEIALITKPSNTQTQANTFFRIWTLKESLAKATSRPIAKLLSPNVFNELNMATLSASSNCVSIESNNEYTQFDVTVAHRKSTDWRCFLITDFIL